jgi:succinate dehydrogenase/fumarate reductase-like Fe-S protein
MRAIAKLKIWRGTASATVMELDDQTVYACTARLEPREMILQPLSNKRLVRDLVTEIAPPAERLLK